jgi:hypothetical protein
MIQKAEYIKDYQIKVYFADGAIRTIDLFSFLSASTHPLINKFLDIELFKQFRIEMGTLCWGDNEFDLNPMNIYSGIYNLGSTISKKKQVSKKPNAETLKALNEAHYKKGFKAKNVDDLFEKLNT